jgi:hypothetical protein
VGLTGAALALGPALQPWLFMWLLAFSLFFGCKWLAWRTATAGRRPRPVQTIAFMLLWVGMDAQAFYQHRQPRCVDARQWMTPLTTIALGAALCWTVAPAVASTSTMLAGWTAMVGLILMFHFGSFHLLALLWRRAGIAVQPIMQEPMRSATLAEFWSQRWNRAFNRLMHDHVLLPLRRQVGLPTAVMAGFLASGLIHDLVISVPAGAGHGLPTAYFLLQGAAVLMERSAVGRRLGLRHGSWRSRLFAAVVLIAPVPCLFHPPFLQRVMIPMLELFGAI